MMKSTVKPEKEDLRAKPGTLTPQMMKSLIGKPGSASKMVALSRLFSGFMKKYPSQFKALPASAQKVMKKYQDVDVTKFAWSDADAQTIADLNKALKPFLKKSLPPKMLEKIKEVVTTTPSEMEPSIPGKGIPSEEESSKPGEKPDSSKEPEEVDMDVGKMSKIRGYFTERYYGNLFKHLPPQVRSELERSGLDPEGLKTIMQKGAFLAVMARRVVMAYIQNT